LLMGEMFFVTWWSFNVCIRRILLCCMNISPLKSEWRLNSAKRNHLGGTGH
jgi:hypothetical protein